MVSDNIRRLERPPLEDATPERDRSNTKGSGIGASSSNSCSNVILKACSLAGSCVESRSDRIDDLTHNNFSYGFHSRPVNNSLWTANV
jgi:hypothetical protein